jgi:hypothetical protein
MTEEQKAAIIFVTPELIKKFGLKLNTGSIVYHHWLDLDIPSFGVYLSIQSYGL